MKYLLLMVCILCQSCNFTKYAKVKTAPDSPVKISNDSIAGYYINEEQVISYKFIFDTSAYLLKSIIVYSDNLPIQVIEANKMIEKLDVQLFDWNFDGYKDISVLYNCGTGGCAYWIWNYSPDKNEYYFNEILSERLGLEIDTVFKYIIFHYRFGWSDEFWDTAQYKGNQLILIKGLHRSQGKDTLGNTYIKNTYYKLLEGNLIEYSDSSIVKRE